MQRHPQLPLRCILPFARSSFWSLGAQSYPRLSKLSYKSLADSLCPGRAACNGVNGLPLSLLPAAERLGERSTPAHFGRANARGAASPRARSVQSPARCFGPRSRPSTDYRMVRVGLLAQRGHQVNGGSCPVQLSACWICAASAISSASFRIGRRLGLDLRPCRRLPPSAPSAPTPPHRRAVISAIAHRLSRLITSSMPSAISRSPMMTTLAPQAAWRYSFLVRMGAGGDHQLAWGWACGPARWPGRPRRRWGWRRRGCAPTTIPASWRISARRHCRGSPGCRGRARRCAWSSPSSMTRKGRLSRRKRSASTVPTRPKPMTIVWLVSAVGVGRSELDRRRAPEARPRERPRERAAACCRCRVAPATCPPPRRPAG